MKHSGSVGRLITTRQQASRMIDEPARRRRYGGQRAHGVHPDARSQKSRRGIRSSNLPSLNGQHTARWRLLSLSNGGPQHAASHTIIQDLRRRGASHDDDAHACRIDRRHASAFCAQHCQHVAPPPGVPHRRSQRDLRFDGPVCWQGAGDDDARDTRTARRAK